VTGAEPSAHGDGPDQEGEDLPAFAQELLEGVTATRDELDLVIGQYAREWTVERMPPVDRTILRLACYELLYRPDTPVGAAIDEAVAAAKELSTEDSGRFVNGVLGAIARGTRLPDRGG
jgi:transcription antitermination protein NusB